MIAVICGSTGLVGNILLHSLLQNDKFSKVISLSRRPVGFKNSKLTEVLTSDLTDLSKQESDLRGDIYFCCLGTTIKSAGSQENFKKVDFYSVCEFAKIAKKFEAKSFVIISAAGANKNSGLFYNRVKGETENALKQLQLNRLVIFRPGLLVGERREFRFGEKLFINALGGLRPIVPAEFEKRIATQVNALAEQMIFKSLEIEAGIFVIEAKNIG